MLIVDGVIVVFSEITEVKQGDATKIRSDIRSHQRDCRFRHKRTRIGTIRASSGISSRYAPIGLDDTVEIKLHSRGLGEF